MIKQYLFENFRVVWDPNTLDTQLTQEQYSKLPDLELESETGDGKTLKIPKESYLQRDHETGKYSLLFKPDDYTAAGSLPGQIFWVVGT